MATNYSTTSIETTSDDRRALFEGGEAGSWKMLALSSPASVLTIQIATDDTTTNPPRPANGNRGQSHAIHF
jgi:hypothetical protein